MFCAQCGKQINDSTRFCNYCGSPQAGQSNQQNSTANPSNSQWQPNQAQFSNQPQQGNQQSLAGQPWQNNQNNSQGQQWQNTQTNPQAQQWQNTQTNPQGQSWQEKQPNSLGQQWLNNQNIQQNQSPQNTFINPNMQANQVPGLIGYSPKIQDPAFTKYSKAASKYSMIFGVVIALVAIIGFPIYGNASGEVDFPQSLYYGFIIGGMFLLIAIVQTLRKGSDTTWDGIVVDKKMARKTYTNNDENDNTVHHYIEYKFVIQRENGKKYKHSFRDQPTMYNYYNQGDRVRHHKGMTYYEKYDKSRDDEILCAACLTMNDIHETNCRRCKCPLLKV